MNVEVVQRRLWEQSQHQRELWESSTPLFPVNPCDGRARNLMDLMHQPQWIAAACDRVLQRSRGDQDTLESRMQGNLARPVWGWGPGEIPGPTPLFAGHDAAAANHARLWSLIASAERHAVDPQRYLTSVLAKIGATPPRELDQFLPDVWKRADAAEPTPTPAAT